MLPPPTPPPPPSPCHAPVRSLFLRASQTHNCRVLQESLYGYHINRNAAATAAAASLTDESNSDRNVSCLPDGIPQQINEPMMDPDLAMALRISEQEEQQHQLDLQREQEMLEEVLRLSLQEK